jgi:hypothetical protein
MSFEHPTDPEFGASWWSRLRAWLHAAWVTTAGETDQF